MADVKKIIDKEIHSCWGNTLIECKISKSDYLADLKKPWRRESHRGIGSFRYYLTTKGLLNPSELPEKWGLLETTGKKIKIIKLAKRFEKKNESQEQSILISAFRRLNIHSGKHTSIKVYSIQTKCRTTLTIQKQREVS